MRGGLEPALCAVGGGFIGWPGPTACDREQYGLGLRRITDRFVLARCRNLQPPRIATPASLRWTTPSCALTPRSEKIACLLAQAYAVIANLLDKILGHPPSQVDFAEIVLREARKTGFKGTLTFEPDQFRLAHGPGQYLFLTNAYRDYIESKRSERPSVVRRYVQMLFTNSEPYDPPLDEARPMMIPIIRNLGAILNVERNRIEEEGRPLVPFQFRRFGEDCIELLALDQPDTISALTHGPPEEWCLTLDQALAIAHENLRDATTEGWEEVVPGVFRGTWSDGYHPSRALLPDVLERAPVKGRPVFMIPTRDILLVTGDRDEDGVLAMTELSHQAFESSGRWVSALAFTYDDEGRPVTFSAPSPEHRRRQLDLIRLLRNEEYAEQKKSLEALHEQRGRDVFVASYFLRDQGDGMHTVSWSAWTEGVEALLPKTDRLVLDKAGRQDGEDLLIVDWDASFPLIGHLLTEEHGHYPPRFRTQGFPDSTVIAQLRSIE